MKNKYTEKDYVNKCNELKLIYVGNHKAKKVGTVIDFICPKHKDKGIQSKDWSHFRTYTIGCGYCTGRYKTTSEIIKEINNPNIEFLSEYIGNEKPIKCKCNICNHEWTTQPKVLITNKSGCPKCGKLKAVKNETKSKEQFVYEMSLINSDIEILGEYINTHTKIKCRCKKCDNVWYGFPANLLNKSAGCPKCSISNGEKTLLDTLQQLHVNYIPQYPIYDGIRKRPLRFDAFDFENNIAYEYNGEQHYYPVDFAGKGEEWANQQFALTQERDLAKIDYCYHKNIEIIIIPYWKKNNMVDFIFNINKEEKDNIA